MEKALTDQLGGLIITYEKALTENPRTKEHDFRKLIAELKEAKEIRNALCHGSWGKPDDQGRTVPKFVRRGLEIFETPVDVAFFKQTRAAPFASRPDGCSNALVASEVERIVSGELCGR